MTSKDILTEEQKERLSRCENINDIWDDIYGPIGTPKRDEMEAEADTFCIAEKLRQERINAGMTQQQLADRIGAKKSYISRIENGKTDVQVKTLFRLFQGLGKTVRVTII
jgi:HTH-type transcriptional regulator/antitoxin HipB